MGENDFLLLVETQCFRNMIVNHGKAFAFKSSEIGCVDPTVVERCSLGTNTASNSFP